MKTLRSIVQQNAFYFISFLIVAILAVPGTGKADCFIALNSPHTRWLGAVFIAMTFFKKCWGNSIAGKQYFFLYNAGN